MNPINYEMESWDAAGYQAQIKAILQSIENEMMLISAIYAQIERGELNSSFGQSLEHE
jgi:hypothetical protein